MRINRRNFIKTGAIATSGVFMHSSILSCTSPKNEGVQLEEYFRSFQNPPMDSKVFVRWWWNGNRLNKDEILRELDVMKSAGIGGVEINPIAFPPSTDPAGYEALTIFEDKWLDMLETALKGAKEREIVCDMIVGSGWPFGGEFLKKEEQTQLVTVDIIELEENKKYTFSTDELLARVNPDFHSKNKDVFKDLIMIRLVPASSDEFVSGEDLLNTVTENKLIVNVPEGKYLLYCVIKLTGYMNVINGSPGAAGPVLNHYNKAAVANYLERISGYINGKVGNMGDYIRAMFCDSMELEGANWNDDLPDEFEKRRGYSILPYLPFLLKKIGQMGNPLADQLGIKLPEEVTEKLGRINLDYYKTRLELFKERFITTFNDWCHTNGVKSRMQAYGRGMHPLEASMEIDIPECETWLFKEVGRDYPDIGLEGRAPLMCNKYVSSAAALIGKKEVSCEEITNTSMVFMATLENIKVAGDQSNISGVNHSVLHGFNYSPLNTEFPGWIRYGTFFNERNTWWPYFSLWSGYKARISNLLQNATPLANVAILQPLTDLWLKFGPQRDPFPQKWYPDYQNNLWEAVHQNGGGCNYVSEKIINESDFENGAIKYNSRSYNYLLLPEIETLDLQTVQSLSDFAEAGGKIVFIGEKPFKSTDFLNQESVDALVKEKIEALMKQGKNSIFIYPAPQNEVINWYKGLQQTLGIKPYVTFSKPQKFLEHSCYQLGDTRMFLISNTGLSEHISVTAEFDVPSGFYPWVWNPETGEKLMHPVNNKNNRINLELPKATSIIIVFENNDNGEIYFSPKQNTEGVLIAGPWQLKLQHINGNMETMELETLKDLVEMEETIHFAGTVLYEKTFQVENKQPQFIDLGNVQGVSECTLNGENLGTRWYGAHLYDISGSVKEGKNLLSVKITTITGNYLKGQTENKVAQNWTRHQEYYPMGLLGPVKII
ncbi:MAG: glycosyl hydrolase [Draconibacterium sp.]